MNKRMSIADKNAFLMYQYLHPLEKVEATRPDTKRNNVQSNPESKVINDPETND